MPLSNWTSDEDGLEQEKISDAAFAFEQWLESKNYMIAVDICPLDSESENGFFNATDAVNLIDDFLQNFSFWINFREEIEKHATNIGPVAVEPLD
jgi:hypothetical protein